MDVPAWILCGVDRVGPFRLRLDDPFGLHVFRRFGFLIEILGFLIEIPGILIVCLWFFAKGFLIEKTFLIEMVLGNSSLKSEFLIEIFAVPFTQTVWVVLGTVVCSFSVRM